MKLQICLLVLCVSLVFSSKPEEKSAAPAEDKKQTKRGLYGLGDHGSLLSGDYHGLESLSHYGPSHEDIKTITIEKEVKVPIYKPYPVHIEKKIPYPVKVPVAVPVDKPYPVHIVKHVPYPVDKPVPYPVEKPVPYPVKVPVKVPVPHPYPVYVKKPVPVFIKEHDLHHGSHDLHHGSHDLLEHGSLNLHHDAHSYSSFIHH